MKKKSILILNARLVNEGNIAERDVYIQDGKIEKIFYDLAHFPADIVVDAKGKYLLPGVIDDQVHFREPGLTHKATIFSESRAAVAGGTTSFMEMPNTIPNALTQNLLSEKYIIASNTSLANYSFFMGASNDNLEEILLTDPKKVCGIKVFMGSSTGNMLVDDQNALEALFRESEMLIATHCEDEKIIKQNTEKYKNELDEGITAAYHPLIRNEAACLASSSLAVSLAKKYRSRLHVLHISTADELALFDNEKDLEDKKITAEVCVHHLWFSADDYARLGNQIKCNPAIKAKSHKEALFKALLDNRLDIIATDHAPHTWEEKQQNYWQAPAGLSLVQHGLNLMLEFYKQGRISLERIVEKMAHAPAICFQVEARGFIREGYWADLVLVDLEAEMTVSKENLFYHCGWSPLEGQVFNSKITHTWVSGHLAYENGIFHEDFMGERLLFDR
jgi:dihydroorotase